MEEKEEKEETIITGISLVHINSRDMLFRRCRQCQFKLVAITQDDVDMLLYCVQCQTTISDFQASYATEVTCFQNGLLVNYKVYDALAGILGCDASTYCEVKSMYTITNNELTTRDSFLQSMRNYRNISEKKYMD